MIGFSYDIIMLLVVLTSLWCVGIHVSGRDEGDLLYFLNKATKDTWLGKPLYNCINCMASIHSAVVIILYFYVSGVWGEFQWLLPNVARLVILWVIVAVICCFTNGLLYMLYVVFEWLIENLQNSADTDENISGTE